MIDRAPNLDAARAAAAALDGELSALDQAPEPGASTSAASSTPSPVRQAIAASRVQLSQILSMVVLNLSTKTAQRWGAHWVYSEQECALVAAAVLDVADLYLDELDGPWLNLLFVLGATAAPRLYGKKLPPLEIEAATSTAPTSPTNGSVAA